VAGAFCVSWAKSNALLKREITERNRVEEELQKKNEELENFVHVVSHELKTPIILSLLRQPDPEIAFSQDRRWQGNAKVRLHASMKIPPPPFNKGGV